MMMVVVVSTVIPVMVMVMVAGDLHISGFGRFRLRRERCIVCYQQFHRIRDRVEQFCIRVSTHEVRVGSGRLRAAQ